MPEDAGGDILSVWLGGTVRRLRHGASVSITRSHTIETRGSGDDVLVTRYAAAWTRFYIGRVTLDNLIERNDIIRVRSEVVEINII